MSYLLDKKAKRKKFFKITLGIIVLIVLFYFRLNIWNGFSYTAHAIFRPLLVLGNNTENKLQNLQSYFASKSSLGNENQELKLRLEKEEARMANYDSLFIENERLKEILERKREEISMTISAILSQTNQSFYDSLIIDVGKSQNIKKGDMVFGLGNIPIGRVANVYSNSSKVILFSTPGEKTEVIISSKSIDPEQIGGTFVELIGRGGGNFEMILPRDFILEKGDQVTMPGINPYVVAVVETIISDPRNPFTKALLTSPVNVRELKFVEIERQK